MRSLGRIFEPIRCPMPKWSAARSAQVAGVRNAKILCIGDSTTADTTLGPKTNSYPTKLATILGGVADSAMSTNNQFSSWATYDPRITLGAGWVSSISGLGGPMVTNTTTANNLSFAVPIAFDTLEIWYPTAATAGLIDVDVDGGTATTITLTGSNGYTKTTISVALGTHTINIRRNSGTAYFQGFVCYNSAAKTNLVLNAGWSGAGVINMTDAASVWSQLNAVAAQAPDLCIIMPGINDWNTAMALATYRASLQTLITTCKSVSDVILIGGTASDPNSFAANGVQATYRAVHRDLAESFGLNYFELAEKWGGFYAAANAAGLMGDPRHPSVTGYQGGAGNYSGSIANLAADILFKAA